MLFSLMDFFNDVLIYIIVQMNYFVASVFFLT